MIDSNNIIYFIKEYFAIIFYLFIISKIVFRVIQRKRKRKRKRKKKSRKGGGILMDIWSVLLCIITFGLSCNFWKKFFKVDNDDYDSSDSDSYDSEEFEKYISPKMNKMLKQVDKINKERDEFFNKYLQPEVKPIDSYGFFLGSQPQSDRSRYRLPSFYN